MADFRDLEAEELALVTFARLSIDLYAFTHCDRTHDIAHEALSRAEFCAAWPRYGNATERGT